MIFWDSSAVVAVVADEQRSKKCREILKHDPRVAIWWQTDDEVLRALTWKHERGALSDLAYREAQKQFALFLKSSIVVAPSPAVKRRVPKLIRNHLLTTADTYQLAAALVAQDELLPEILFLTSDAKLEEAAVREGFSLPVSVGDG